MFITENERSYLLEAIKELLDEYGYDYSVGALKKIIVKWEEEKGWLVEAFKKHPNYIEGKFMIAFDQDFDRDIDSGAVWNFRCWLMDTARNMADTLPEEVKERIKRGYWSLDYLPADVYELIESMNYNGLHVRTLDEHIVEVVNKALPEVKAREGEKASRCVNRICKYLGYDKHPDYNREYAKYADAVSPVKIKRHTVLSVNPLDYLTMSFGNSWSSCHTIDKENRRGMPSGFHGQYSSGTMSYMLDSASMVFYTVDKEYEGNEYSLQPKINRQMYHFGEDKLVQGRLYPQGNDNNGDGYTQYRKIVQNIMATIFEFPNLWTVSHGAKNASKYVDTWGTHYADYSYFDSCTLSKITGQENELRFEVGSRPICIECGCEHAVEENISCCAGEYYICEDCGCRVSEDDAIYIDGEYYCRDCCTRCECCDEWHRNEDVTYVNGYGDVCNCCLDDGEYFFRCEECDEWVHTDDAHWVESEDGYVCQRCRDRYYCRCSDCGELFRTEDMHKNKDGEMYCDDCYEEVEEDEENEESEAC